METVDRIFELADAQFKEQRDFAAAIGVEPSIVSQWRTGVTKSYEKRLRLNKIANVLGTTVQYLITGEKKEPTPVSESEPLDHLTAQLMDFACQLTPEQKKFLLAQMKTLLENRE